MKKMVLTKIYLVIIASLSTAVHAQDNLKLGFRECSTWVQDESGKGYLGFQVRPKADSNLEISIRPVYDSSGQTSKPLTDISNFVVLGVPSKGVVADKAGVSLREIEVQKTGLDLVDSRMANVKLFVVENDKRLWQLETTQKSEHAETLVKTNYQFSCEFSNVGEIE